MNIIKTITKLHLSARGGVYRALPLFTQSCVAEGYGKRIQRVAGMNFGAAGAIGNGKGLHTLYEIDTVVRDVAKKIRRNPTWIRQTRTRGAKTCMRFANELAQESASASTHPEKFLRFVIRAYPDYMGGIGAFNLFWRYLEFATPDMPRFPRQGLRALAVERNKIAEIYPRCEQAMREAMQTLGKKLQVNLKLLLAMTRSELARTLRTSSLPVSKAVLTQRTKGYVHVYYNGKEEVATGILTLNAVRTYIRSEQHSINSGVLTGRTVFPGRVIGTVVKRSKRASWPHNPILVVPMTHPSDIPYLKRIKGLVTDEGGGILSHAAIVARELGIPCVIGTRIATQVFREGDRIILDATIGSVRKI